MLKKHCEKIIERASFACAEMEGPSRSQSNLRVYPVQATVIRSDKKVFLVKLLFNAVIMLRPAVWDVEVLTPVALVP